MICASRSSADMVGRRKEEEEGDVFVEFNHLMAVELMLLCILEGGREGGREGGSIECAWQPSHASAYYSQN